MTRNFVLVLAPRYASNLFLLPMFLAAVSLTVWFLARGIDVRKLEVMSTLATPRPGSMIAADRREAP
jgi:hypothetical protein